MNLHLDRYRLFFVPKYDYLILIFVYPDNFPNIVWCLLQLIFCLHLNDTVLCSNFLLTSQLLFDFLLLKGLRAIDLHQSIFLWILFFLKSLVNLKFLCFELVLFFFFSLTFFWISQLKLVELKQDQIMEQVSTTHQSI